jgi:pimeloyl-ACP methyl ester carboxylesterase
VIREIVMDNPTFILVHGAWQSAATWDLVTPRLQAAGYSAKAPELTGLESSESLTAAVNLQTHIQDVGRALDSVSGEVILVGHSYAGMIITAAAERARNIKRLVYVDAFVPDDGQCALDLMPDAVAQMFRDRAVTDGDGWRLPAGESHLDLWGLQPGGERDFVRDRMTDFSLRCFEQPVRLPRSAASSLPRTYVAAVKPGYPARAVFQRFAEKALGEHWAYVELPTGHDCHVEMPDAFVEVLVRAASIDTARAGA